MSAPLPDPDDHTAYRTLYGRRHGKPLRAGHQTLIDSLLPRLRIALPQRPPIAADGTIGLAGERLDPRSLFQGDSPQQVWLEIGFGAGEHLVWQAAANPSIGLVGCEPFVNGVARCLAGIERAGVSNVRLFDDDARLLLGALADASLDRVFILFPDPWPKRRHHKRRLVARPTLDRLAQLMRPGAELRLATDDPSYLPWMVEHACLHPAFDWTARRPADWRGRPADWPPTRYEQKMLAGHPPSFLILRRR